MGGMSLSLQDVNIASILHLSEHRVEVVVKYICLFSELFDNFYLE